MSDSFVTPWTVACQPPLFMGFLRQEYWSELPFPSPGDLPDNAGDARSVHSIPGLGRYPRVGNGNPLQYSCLGNPMDREARWATVHGVTKESDMT